MGKKGDPKVPILPSTTRKGTTLSTSATLDSPSILRKFASPPTHAASTKSGTISDAFDDASTVFDESGSLGPFLDTRIAEAREKESKTLVAKANFLEERYIEIDDEFYEDYLACSKSADPGAIKKLLENML